MEMRSDRVTSRRALALAGYGFSAPTPGAV